MTVVRLVHCADEAVRYAKWIDLLELFGAENMEVVADEAAQTLNVVELVHPVLQTRDAQRPGRMEAGRKAGLGGQHVAVEAHRMRAHRHDGGVVGEMRAQAGGVPGRPGGQLVLLD